MSRNPFPKQIIDEAEAIPFPTSISLRPQAQGITIDGDYSRDLDDAIWIESKASHTILSVHIADVSELVHPGTLLDQEAIARTQTLYFRHNNAPMLPRCLSEDKLSLLEQQPRPTVTLEITLDNTAQIQHFDVYESWLASCKRFSYKQADTAIQNQNLPYSELLNDCWQWAERLYYKRIHAKNFDGLNLPEGYFLDENGNLLSTQFTQHHSYLIIQEFMILANTAIAGWLVENNIPAIFRNHTHRVIGPEQTHRFEALEEAQSEEEIRRILMSWLNPAEYGSSALGHFALNLEAYCHFTSPIRRVPDLINHRMVKAHLHNQFFPYSTQDINQFSQHIEQVIRTQEEATKTYYKDKQHQLYKAQLQDPDLIEYLPERDFSLLLRYAIEEKQGKIVKEEAMKRLLATNLPIEDLFVLLMLGDDLELQQQVIHFLQDHIHHAPSLISIAQNQLEDWESFAWVEINSISPFAAWLEILMNQRILTTASPAIASNKTRARHQACFDWLIAYREGTLVQPEQRELPPLSTPPQPKSPTAISKLKQYEEGQNSLSLLFEICQSLQWPQPLFEIINQDGGFQCECKIDTRQGLVSGCGHAARKRQAKHQAAHLILVQLKAHLSKDISSVTSIVM